MSSAELVKLNSTMIGILCQHRSGHSAYEQNLSNTNNLEMFPELDINCKDVDLYFDQLPKNSVFSMMVSPNSFGLMQKYKNINWQIFMRKDVITQCLSFIYTNKTQIIRDNQTQIVDVDINLIDYFVDNFKIVNDIKSKNIYPVYYYEDQSMPNTVFKKNNNNYKKLIKNIDDVMEKINYLLP